MFDDLKRLFRHGGIYLVGNILNRVGAFVLLPLYTKHLAVAEYGVLELLYTTVAVISVVFSAGLSHTTLRFYYDYTEERDRHAVVVTNLVTILMLGIFGAIAVHFVRGPISVLLFDTLNYRNALDLCLAIMVLEMSTEIGFAYLRAREQSFFYVWLSVARLLLQVSLSIYLVARRDMGIDGVLWANLASVALAWLVVIGYTFWNCGVTVRTSLIPAMLRYSLPMAGSGVIGAIMLNVDRLLLKEMSSLEAVGLYALAMKFAMLLTFLVAEPFYRAYGPFRFSILHKENASAIQATVLYFLVAGASFVALEVALFMPEVLHFMAAPAYLSASHYAPLLLAGGIVGAATYCFETGILVAKRTNYLLYISVAILMVKVALNFALIPWLGIHGAVLAFFVTALVRARMINSISQRLFPVAYAYAPLWRIAFIATVVYLASLGLDEHIWMVSIPAKLLLSGVFAAALYFTDNEIRRLVDRGILQIKMKHGS